MKTVSHVCIMFLMIYTAAEGLKFVGYAGSKWLYLSNTKQTRDRAEEICSKRDMCLVDPETLCEFDDLISTLENNMDSGAVHIGLYLEDRELRSSNMEELSYEPEMSVSYRDNECVQVIRGSETKVAGVDCSKKRNFICEKAGDVIKAENDEYKTKTKEHETEINECRTEIEKHEKNILKCRSDIQLLKLGHTNIDKCRNEIEELKFRLKHNIYQESNNKELLEALKKKEETISSLNQTIRISIGKINLLENSNQILNNQVKQLMKTAAEVTLGPTTDINANLTSKLDECLEKRLTDVHNLTEMKINCTIRLYEKKFEITELELKLQNVSQEKSGLLTEKRNLVEALKKLEELIVQSKETINSQEIKNHELNNQLQTCLRNTRETENDGNPPICERVYKGLCLDAR